MNLEVDPERLANYGDTGIYVRARLHEKWGSYDIVTLTKPSLIDWLKSRGGDNPWAEATVCVLLGHNQ